MTEELLNQAKAAKTPAELLELAKTAGHSMTEEEAGNVFALLNPPAAGELSDEELDNVSGGGCGQGQYTANGRLKTTIGYGCEYYEKFSHFGQDAFGVDGTCCKCRYWDTRNLGYGEFAMILGAPGVCTHPWNYADYKPED